MSQFDKLLIKLKSLNKTMRFHEIRKILEAYGYQIHSPRGGSSHMTFRKDGKPPITIPVHEPIKRVYILMVKKIVESEDNEDTTENP